MTRLGWAILLLVLAGIGAIVSLTSFGGFRARAPAPPASPPGGGGALIVPVAGVARVALADTWGDPRDGGARPHHGLDIAAPGGTPVLAAAAGQVEKLFLSRAGGITAYVRTGGGRAMHYYAHLAGYAPGLHEGQAVRAGEAIGFVGDTGNAGAGNTHLHFGVARMRAGERWWQGEPVNPYPLLAGPPPRR